MQQFRPFLTAAALIALGAAPLAAQTESPAPDSPTPARQEQRAMKAHDFARLTVNGLGEASAQPDMATITVGVSTRAATAAEAMSQNAEQQNAVIEVLKAEGIEARDIRTTSLDLSPVLDYSQDGQPPKLTGYNARNNVTVRLRDLPKLGALLDSLVTSGANEIGGIAFSREDMTEAEDRARAAAVANARHRAEIMAEAAGMKLGPLLRLSDAQLSEPRPVAPMFARAQASAPAATPVEAGELTVSAHATAIFAMRPLDAPQDGMPPATPGQGDGASD
ncbi:hypothetical protein SAMN04487972_101103 [Paracoccus halophilus]|uniref:Outer membrane protein n=1 Tax=Paracoccus halophilus TaxID=376733 RepID=A0A099F896_9RHOB|nr:SIMPL domain-containing protein [Paracoccus halophilus]KGJ06451.1 hypothetical protein IT41_02080 [Paracoccus halophilus]SFA38234.1 hypothetical protein SAMN04487972_101103 [Paracoccus halophilus]